MVGFPGATGPSRWWTILAAISAALALAVGVTAFVYQRNASRPIGEGQLFYADSQEATVRIEALLDSGQSRDEAVRRVRNDLGIEAVFLVDETGTVIAATSDSLLGTTLSNPVLQFAFGSARFGAVAAPLDGAVQVDGVTEWEAGEVLYMALLPGADGAVVLYYDIAELLQRRAATRGIQPETLQLAGVALLLAVAAAVTLVERARIVREMVIESEFLRKESEVLQRHNVELERARNEAERALALAEEKNRIRSEFVLMINHELRTPLTSIVTGGELLSASASLDGDERQILDALVHDARRLQTMIDQLLALARVENRGLSFKPQPVPLAEVLRAASDSHGRLLWDEDGCGCAGLEAITDLQTLTQLVASLVDNAYTHGATSVRVEGASALAGDADLVVGTVPPDAAFISVVDDGPGIRPEFLPRAFEKFEKDSRSSGTGLGLYMARLMAEAIGAALEVRTSPAGTTISIAMPVVGATEPVPA